MITALTIAGSDSSGGAGIQQDLKVFSSFRIHGASVITAVTAQNTRKVNDYIILPLHMIEKQIDSVMYDMSIKAVKTGMLASANVIALIIEKIREYKIENLVVDPVMVATSTDRLLDEDAVEEMKKLLSVAKISTPNIYEAEILSGIDIKSTEDMERAASRIGNCVIKGGHINATDVLFWNNKTYRFESRIRMRNVRLHGTGCAFSAAITSCLAKGMDVIESVRVSKEFMDNSIERYFSVGSGSRLIDVGNIKITETTEDLERERILNNIETAVERFISVRDSYKLIPQVGSNIGMALKGAKRLNEIAGISGRIIRVNKGSMLSGIIRFGGTLHIGRVILTAMKFKNEVRSAMNIRYSKNILDICSNLNYRISKFDRGKEPDGVKTMEWGTEEAIKNSEGFPDVIYDTGCKGKEAMIRIIGRDAIDVVNKTLKILRLIE